MMINKYMLNNNKSPKTKCVLFIYIALSLYNLYYINVN